MRKILITAALLLASATAHAEVLDLRISHIPPHWNLDRGPRIIHVPPPATEAELAAEDRLHAEWLAFCKPVKRVDALGVTRLSYARRGCEFGRTAE